MEARLIFSLPDDQMEFDRANQSLNMACALFDILQLRKAMEREFESTIIKDTTVYDGIDAMSEGIANILNEYNIDIDRLIG